MLVENTYQRETSGPHTEQEKHALSVGTTGLHGYQTQNKKT